MTDAEKLPLISVIMPAYRSRATIGRAIRSVIGQGFENWELCIVDDACPDRSIDAAITAAAGDSRVRVQRLAENLGAGGARNAALAMARGRYLAFLDADDEWLPEKLAVQLAHMKKTGAALCFSGFWRHDGAQRHEVKVPARVDHAGLLRGNVIGCLTAMVDAQAFDTPIRMSLQRRRQDYALWLSLLRGGKVAHGVQAPLAIYHVNQGSLSSGRFRALAATWQVYRQAEGLGRLQSAAYVLSHVLGRLRRG